jgi:hypothetical protein
MSPSTLFLLNIILFVICIVIQYKAIHRMAYNRGLFIQISMFFFTGLVYIAPNAPRFLVWLFFFVTWALTLMLTAYSIRRLRLRKR